MTADVNIAKLPTEPGPIGVFDSGYGGLTVLRELRERLPQYDYLYLGDNARAPYGSRSFELVYRFTLQAVEKLFSMGCHLVILACNTASAKALRTIQQRDLPRIDESRRVLGVIRPTVEALGSISGGHVGVLGTPGTIASQSYDIEVAKLYPDFKLSTHACPLWAALVESRESDGPGADYFVKKDLDALLAMDPELDTIVLGCTHYPLLVDKIKKYVPTRVNLLSQGKIVADSLADYLNRHPEMERRLRPGTGHVTYLTTEEPERFNDPATIFAGQEVKASHIEL